MGLREPNDDSNRDIEKKKEKEQHPRLFRNTPPSNYDICGIPNVYAS